ncbi:Guanyl-specific ribonuclease Sa [Corynebacterium freiburgense]|nr:Guanyl-specific ribonuclease Sa [Corynebacterium freiburgense]
MLQSIGGAVLVIAAAWLGIDLSQNNGTQSTTQSNQVTQSSAPQDNQPKQKDQATSNFKANRSGLPSCPVNTLPDQANDVIDDILAGGPFEHPGIDGKHFGNYERILPKEKSSFYREYTVDTPGVNHRGERRIVVGGGSKQDPDTWYYTDDHYESFCVIPDAEN